VIVYTGNGWIMNALAWIKMRVHSVLTYAY